MAAATATGRKLNRIAGDIRVVNWSSVVFAASGDTLTIPGIKSVNTIDFTPTTNASYGFTISGNVITIVSGGAVTGQMSVRGL